MVVVTVPIVSAITGSVVHSLWSVCMIGDPHAVLCLAFVRRNVLVTLGEHSLVVLPSGAVGSTTVGGVDVARPFAGHVAGHASSSVSAVVLSW